MPVLRNRNQLTYLHCGAIVSCWYNLRPLRFPSSTTINPPRSICSSTLPKQIGNKKSDKPPLHWSDFATNAFVSMHAEWLMKYTGKKPNSKVWEQWGIDLQPFLNCIPDPSQLKSKKERMKVDYDLYTQMRNHIGLGYNPTNHKFEASDEVWETFFEGLHKKNKKTAEKIKQEGLPNHELYSIIFHGKRAEGQGAFSSLNAPIHDSDPENENSSLSHNTLPHSSSATEKGKSTIPSSSKYIRKKKNNTKGSRITPEEIFQASMDKICNVISMSRSESMRTTGKSSNLMDQWMASSLPNNFVMVAGAHKTSLSDEEIVAIVTACYLAYRHISPEQRQVRQTSALTRYMRVQEYLNGHHESMFNMSFTNRLSQDRWQHSAETVSRYFGKVLDAIVEVASDFIRPPNFDEVPQLIQNNKDKYVAEIEGRDPDPSTDDVDGLEVGIEDNADVVQSRFRDQFDMGVFRDRLAIRMWKRYERRP
ncbi:Myb/SANT-like domain containing protein [Trema orientale]|uniref:Myb/SANT-like domain containing protein n=1 Tax=Trema orientale TaxID=63057 RepID=A0A2P5DRG0_TREOI|nr:Myb/SANT-like domain containing protein [Trema orientale]